MERTIDIQKILYSKMGSKARFVPRFVINWFRNIIHEDEVNQFLWENRDKTGTEWLTECVHYLRMTLEIEGLENLPDKNDGKLYTFVSNHPLGGQDGVALGSIIGKHYDGKFRYLLNDLLLNLPGLEPVSIGINKTGKQSRDFTYIENVIEANLKACLASHEAAGQAYNIAYGGREYLIDIYYALTKALRVDIEPKYGPDRAGDIKHSNADISKAKKMLGYDPDYDFERGLNEAIAWYREYFSR